MLRWRQGFTRSDARAQSTVLLLELWVHLRFNVIGQGKPAGVLAGVVNRAMAPAMFSFGARRVTSFKIRCMGFWQAVCIHLRIAVFQQATNGWQVFGFTNYLMRGVDDLIRAILAQVGVPELFRVLQFLKRRKCFGVLVVIHQFKFGKNAVYGINGGATVIGMTRIRGRRPSFGLCVWRRILKLLLCLVQQGFAVLHGSSPVADVGWPTGI